MPKKKMHIGDNVKIPLIVVAVISVVLVGIYMIETPSSDQTPFVVTIAKGPIVGASVSAYKLNDDGTKGGLLSGPFKSDSSGNVNLFLPQDLPPIILVESVGGSYRDEATGLIVQLSSADVTRSIMKSDLTRVSITPFTDMAATLVINKIGQGTPAADAVKFANTIVAQQYNIRDILDTAPADAVDRDSVAVADYEQRKYGLLLAGLAQQAKDMDVKPSDLEDALVRDWSDGMLDGNEDGSPITMEDSNGQTITVSASTGLGDLQVAGDKFRRSESDATDLKSFSIIIKPISADPTFYIDSSSSYAWVAGQPGSFQLTSNGGTSPYIWTVKKGSFIPNEFALSEGGVLSGTAPLLPSGTTARITPPFTVVVTDSTGAARELELRITIVNPAPIIATLQGVCVENADCNVRIATANGGTPPYYFRLGSFRDGAPPFGIGVGLDGSVTGKSKRAGTYTFEVCVVDLVGGSSCNPATLTVTPENAAPAARPEPPAANRTPVADGLYSLTIIFAGTGTGGVALVTEEGGVDNPKTCSSPSPCVLKYKKGERVGLGEKTDEGSLFSGWSGACPEEARCAVTMDSDKQVTVTFEKEPEVEVTYHTLTVTKSGTGTGLVSNPPNFEVSCGDTCSAELSFPRDYVVTIVATPDEGSTFVQWSGPCDPRYELTDPTCWIDEMTGDETVEAQFDLVAPEPEPRIPTSVTIDSFTCVGYSNGVIVDRITYSASGTVTGNVGDGLSVSRGAGGGTITGGWTGGTYGGFSRAAGDSDTTSWTYEDSGSSNIGESQLGPRELSASISGTLATKTATCTISR
jgi:hypothetical protein